MDSEKRAEYANALNTYYKLKTAYENAYNKDKNKIIKMKGLSWKEKRVEFAKLKPKCINCKRPVGTLFYTTNQKGERSLVAKCGDKSNPCPLNIVIDLGYIVNLSTELINDEKTISDVKNEIIIDKNNLLFGYITSKEAVDKFDDIKESYTITSSNYEFFLGIYNSIVDNKEKKNELKKNEMDAQLMIDNIKKMMKDFDRTQNVQFVNDVVELYVKEMTPKLKEIMRQKYAASLVEYDDNTNMFSLIQIPVSIEGLESDLAEKEHGVISMQMGLEERAKKTRVRTVKVRPESEMKIVIPKKQTKKVRKPVLVLQPETEAEVEKETIENLELEAPNEEEKAEVSEEERSEPEEEVEEEMSESEEEED
jgi:hypothetical protein